MIMYDYNPYYNRYYRRYGYEYNNLFNQYYNPTFSNTTNSNNNNAEDEKNNETFNNTNNENTKQNNFRLGPLQINDDNIELFGFSIAIDDLILIGIIILLFCQTNRDYTLLIILGLLLFNISFSNLNFF